MYDPTRLNFNSTTTPSFLPMHFGSVATATLQDREWQARVGICATSCSLTLPPWPDLTGGVDITGVIGNSYIPIRISFFFISLTYSLGVDYPSGYFFLFSLSSDFNRCSLFSTEVQNTLAVVSLTKGNLVIS